MLLRLATMGNIRALWVLGAAVVAGAAIWLARRQGVGMTQEQMDLARQYQIPLATMRQLPERAYKYLGPMFGAEQRYKLPHGILARMALIESAYRPEVIDGTIKGASGEVGILQITPRWHPGVNAANPFEAILYAAKYLAEQYKRFGSWSQAVAAYNWGPGNVAAQGIDAAPAVTKKYVAAIQSDVGVA